MGRSARNAPPHTTDVRDTDEGAMCRRQSPRVFFPSKSIAKSIPLVAETRMFEDEREQLWREPVDRHARVHVVLDLRDRVRHGVDRRQLLPETSQSKWMLTRDR